MRTLSRTIIVGLVAAILVFAVAPCIDTVPAPVLAESVPVDQALESPEPALGLSQGSDPRDKPDIQNLPTAEEVSVLQLPAEVPYAAGDIVQTWSTGLTRAWGLGYNIHAADLWLGDIGVAGGTDLDYRFLTNGANTGDTIDISWAGAFAADMTYNPYTGMLWQVGVAGDTGDNCIHELDPVNRVPTGNTICPAWSASQRGLAYDPLTNTYFAGSWNDDMIHHFAANGTMLDEVDVGLPIAGLAYNPGMQYLYAIINTAPNPVFVLDAADNYNILGGFTLAGFSDYGGAGLAMDYYGYLWAVDQQTQIVYQFDTGPDPYEPDNTPSQAQWIYDGAPQRHNIVPVGDVDWLKFSLSEESEVVLETSGWTGDTRLFLFDRNLNQIDYNDDWGGTLFSQIDRLCGIDALPAGTYYVGIDEYGNDHRLAGYQIAVTVQICSQSVYLPLVLRNYRPWDAYYEENDDCQTAYGPLASGQAYRAYPDDTNDYYYFELPSTRTVNISVRNFAPTSTHGTVVLLGPASGDECGPYITHYGLSGDSDMVLAPQTLGAGKYHIQVYVADSSHYSSTELYTLRVTY